MLGRSEFRLVSGRSILVMGRNKLLLEMDMCIR